MITDTIQNALKRLFYSIGGNADKVRDTDDVNAIIDEMSALQLNDRLNQMEDGIETSAPIIVTVTNNVASMTSTQIKQAIASGKVVILQVGDARYYEVDAAPPSFPDSVAFFKNALLAAYRFTIDKDGNCSSGVLSAGTYSKPSGGIPETDLAQGVKDKLDPFIITLTPTSPNYSGTTDTTMADIVTAYNAGRDIWFDLPALGMKTRVTSFHIINESVVVPNITGVLDMGDLTYVQVYVYTSQDGSKYSVFMSPLTPAT